MVHQLKGPIMIFGAGGFIGINLLKRILNERCDIIGVSSDPQKSWRIIQNKIPAKNIHQCDLLDEKQLASTIKRYKPQTVFNLAAYGAYSKQKDIPLIYQTNFNSTVKLIEMLKTNGFCCYVQAGSNSEYGLNADSPAENDELTPNSHYAVSKIAIYYLLKYLGKIEKLPVVHLRFYSVYGPWEEPDRLIPVLIRKAKLGDLPDFVDPDISRDFIYIDDLVDACITVAAKLKKTQYGEAYNVATGKKTTIGKLAFLAKKLFKIKKQPRFGTMPKRRWDVKNWWGNPKKIEKTFGWKAKISLEEGLLKFFNYGK